MKNVSGEDHLGSGLGAPIGSPSLARRSRRDAAGPPRRVTTLLLTLSLALSGLVLPAHAVGEIRIMPVGDSVTAGYPNDFAHNSYRYPLYGHLGADGWTPVGPYQGVSSSNLEPQVGYTEWPLEETRHAGKGGASVAELAGLVGQWTADHDPDVVLAFPGFVSPGSVTVAHIESLIAGIRGARGDAKILFGLPYFGYHPTAETEAYRTKLSQVAQEQDTVASPIRLVDMDVGWVEAYHGNSDSQTRYPAEPHGNARLAMRWADALSRYWGVGEAWPAAAAPMLSAVGDRVAWPEDDRADQWEIERDGSLLATIDAVPDGPQHYDVSETGTYRVRGVRSTATPDDPGRVDGAWSDPVEITSIPDPDPGSYFDDFSQDATGGFPSRWSALRNDGDARVRQLADGRTVLTVTAAGSDQRVILSFDEPTQDPDLRVAGSGLDTKVLLRMRRADQTHGVIVGHGLQGGTAWETRGLGLNLDAAARDYRPLKHVDGEGGWLGADETSFSRDATDQWLWTRTRVAPNSTDFDYKVWFDGDAEPAAWESASGLDLPATDHIGLIAYTQLAAQQTDVDIAFYSVIPHGGDHPLYSIADPTEPGPTPDPGSYDDDFTQDADGSSPSRWSSLTDDGTATVRELPDGRSVLNVSLSGTQQHRRLSFDAPSQDPDLGVETSGLDTKVLLRMNRADHTHSVVVGHGWQADPWESRGLGLNLDGAARDFRPLKHVSGAAAWLGQDGTSFSRDATEEWLWVRTRIGADSTTIEYKVWFEGETEPSTWYAATGLDLPVTDHIGLWFYTQTSAQGVDADIDFYSVVPYGGSHPSVPSAPSQVSATAGDGTVDVSWMAASVAGDQPITSYEVTATPVAEGLPPLTRSVTGSPPPTHLEFDGLTNGVTYTFTVRASIADRTGPVSAPSEAVTPTAGPDVAEPLLFVPSTPCAVFDTRHGEGAWAGPAYGGTSSVFTVAGAVPPQQGGAGCVAAPAGARAVMLNLVAVDPLVSGNLRVAAAGQTAVGGVLNFSAGANIANAVPVALDSHGQIAVDVNASGVEALHVRGVVLGYYVTPDTELVGTEGLAFVPTTPCAVLDTRTGTQEYAGPVTGGSATTFAVSGHISPAQGGEACTAPPADAAAVMLNLVAVDPTHAGNLRAAAAGETAQGGVVNFNPGVNVANAIPVETAGGQVTLEVNASTASQTHLRAVLLGYFIPTDRAPADVEPLAFVPTTPCAVFDTRSASGALAGPAAGGSTSTFTVLGAIPTGQGAGACQAGPAQATALMLNLVAINATTAGNLRAAPAGVAPRGGVLNYRQGENIANAFPLSVTAGQADISVNASQTASVHLRGVSLGYFLPIG
jgi:hypothetical protein